MRIEIDKSGIEKHKGKIKFLVILLVGIIFLSIAFSIIQRGQNEQQEVKVEKVEVKQEVKEAQSNVTSEQLSLELMESMSGILPIMIVMIVGMTIVVLTFRVFSRSDY